MGNLATFKQDKKKVLREIKSRDKQIFLLEKIKR